jgi:hypothetical protein
MRSRSPLRKHGFHNKHIPDGDTLIDAKEPERTLIHLIFELEETFYEPVVCTEGALFAPVSDLVRMKRGSF